MRKHLAQSVPTFYLDDVAVELAGVTGATGSGVAVGLVNLGVSLLSSGVVCHQKNHVSQCSISELQEGLVPE